MATKFTETLEVSRQLLKIYQEHGRRRFLDMMATQTAILADECRHDPREINSRLSTILFGILSVLYSNESEQIMRNQVRLAENFINEPATNGKIRIFLDELDRFLAVYEEERQEKTFSDRILMHLATCPLPELRRLTISSLAETFDYHPNYLSNKFSKEQGVTLQQSITTEKLNRAWCLLKDNTGRTSVKQVSQQIGFADPAYFSQLFKKHFGLLPHETQEH
ncbi:MAG: helix-turn-helix transcriptional regulator [Acidobacteria bacterium]|nr:helix-turn-helix transcriptional regulator [Acidobacteriota bacterium]